MMLPSVSAVEYNTAVENHKAHLFELVTSNGIDINEFIKESSNVRSKNELIPPLLYALLSFLLRLILGINEILLSSPLLYFIISVIIGIYGHLLNTLIEFILYLLLVIFGYDVPPFKPP